MAFDGKTKDIFEKIPLWKALLKFSWPNIFMMFSIGLYTFIDSILAVNLANSSYTDVIKDFSSYTTKDLVRVFMNTANPIVMFLTSMSMLFGVGVSIRYSINFGAKKHDQVMKTLRTGFMVTMIVSFLLIPVTMIAAKPWMATMYEGATGLGKTIIVDKSYDYAKVLIWATPFTMFNQTISGLFRSEGKMKLVTILMVPSLLINLFLDWVFMGPIGMGVAGAAWATAISYAMLTCSYLFIIFHDKKTNVKFKNLIGFKNLSWIAAIGIILVGIAPFLRTFAQSIAGTFENREIGDISTHFNLGWLYGRNILAGAFPVFGLAFPVIFGFSQAASPIAAYNYGAKNYKRVKQTIYWTILYSAIFGLIAYALIATPYMLGQWLLVSLGVQDAYMSESLRVLSVLMIGLPVFGITIAAMTLFTSTDRLLFSIIANSLRGFILFFPFLYLFKYLTINFGSSIDLFWWFYPTTLAATSLCSIAMMIYVFRNLENKPATLDSRLEKLGNWFNKKFGKKSVVSQNTKIENQHSEVVSNNVLFQQSIDENSHKK